MVDRERIACYHFFFFFRFPRSQHENDLRQLQVDGRNLTISCGDLEIQRRI